jgi:hypothetical protein
VAYTLPGTFVDNSVPVSPPSPVGPAVNAASLNEIVTATHDLDNRVGALESGTVTIPADQTTSFTMALSSAGNSIGCNSATALTVTVPPNSSVAFSVGAVIELRQTGVGRVTVAAGAGVTLNAADGFLTTRVQYSTVSLMKIATNTWQISGDTAAT